MQVSDKHLFEREVSISMSSNVSPLQPEDKPLTKKQQAILDRETELLDLAKMLVEQGGYANLTMDKLAAASPYSKGTIYNHFNSKEDVIVALCIKVITDEIALFKRIQTFEGGTREKVVAIQAATHIHTRMDPTFATTMLMAKTTWVSEKASKQRMDKLNQLEELIVDLADELITSAIEAKDLSLANAHSVDTIVFATWAMAFGSNALIVNATNSRCIERIKDRYSVLYNVNMLLDGLGWVPLSQEFDYRKTWRRVEEELFSDEIAYLESIGR